MRPRFRRSSTGNESDEVTPSRAPDDDTSVDVGVDDDASFDAFLARQLDRVDGIEPVEPTAPDPTLAERPVETSEEPVAWAEPRPDDFWDRYDLATAEAELAVPPPAAVVAVVGPLDAAMPVVRRCRDRHWMGQCDVFVLTQHSVIADEPDWTVVGQPSDLVAVLEDRASDFPLLVLDVPCDLPAFVRPLVAHLRHCGVGLVHYVLDDDPVDEDLATWHGELGQPSVLDLAGPVPCGRVLELVDRGDPVVSVAGRDLTTELLLAMRVEQTVTV